MGDYYYDGNKINAVDSIQNNPDTLAMPQMITYTSFKKASFIADTVNSLDIFYGPDQQRIKTVYKEDGSTVKIKYYSDNFEKDSTANGAREISYIYCPYGLAAINIKQSNADSLYFVDSDHLGSILALIKPDGTVPEEYSDDAGLPAGALHCQPTSSAEADYVGRRPKLSEGWAQAEVL